MAATHKIRPFGRNSVAQTYCGVDPYRRKVRTDATHGEQVTCRECLKQADREAAQKTAR